ncbi:hypothetical protein C435_03328 [Haloarcula marismortui ATCC 33799]|jgi:hypothetical protein|uniref:Uncharacterized protein n=2 Tax=Haloarcula marismortui TaxID=2238 RepID=M0KUA3_9EURY|nr:hypothetical protein C435_03328 [Haloarcula californiae ATCC 33799]
MMLKIEKADKRKIYFGVSDFSVVEQGVEVAFWPDTGLRDDEVYQVEEGTVIAAVDETGYDAQGAYETIGDYGVDDGCEVTVCVSERSPGVANGAARLNREKKNGEYRGDFTLVARA